MTTHPLAAPLQACAAGILAREAGVGLLIANQTFLYRDDFTGRFIRHATSISDGATTTTMADIDWAAAITALDAGELPCSGAEKRILRLAASLADDIPVSLADTITGLDEHNVRCLLAAISHASGQTKALNTTIF